MRHPRRRCRIANGDSQHQTEQLAAASRHQDRQQHRHPHGELHASASHRAPITGRHHQAAQRTRREHPPGRKPCRKPPCAPYASSQTECRRASERSGRAGSRARAGRCCARRYVLAVPDRLPSSTATNRRRDYQQPSCSQPTRYEAANAVSKAGSAQERTPEARTASTSRAARSGPVPSRASSPTC